MSIEKCFVIYFPLKSKTVCTVKTAKWATGVVGIILVGYDLQYLIISEPIVGKNGVVYCEFQVTYTDTLELVDSILYSFGPFILMLITNFAIIFKFIRAKCKSKQINSTESTSQSLLKSATRGTAMVVTVCVTFLILTAPSAAWGTLLRWYSLGILYKAFMNSTQYLNYSINGILYCIVGSKFRGELLTIYKARHAHKRLYTVLPKYSKIQVLPGITSCRLMKYNKQAIELNSLLINNMPKDGYGWN